MQFLIFTEGGKFSGGGHITRCASFCEELAAGSQKTKLIIRLDEPGDETILKNIDSAGADIEIIDWTDMTELKKLTDAALRNTNENSGRKVGVIADSYRAEPAVYEYLCKISAGQIFFDDYKRIDYPGGYVLNGAISAKNLNYVHGPENKTRFLLGPEYQTIRSEFIKTSAVKIKKNISKILITCGAGESGKAYKRILKPLREKLPEAEINVVTGAAFTNNYKQNYNNELNKIFFFNNISASVMADLMSKSDFTISACGQTLYELSCVGAPVVAFISANNQKNNAEGFLKLKSIEYCGDINDRDFDKNFAASINKIIDYDYRLELNARSKSIIDGRGAQRCLKKVFNI